MAKPKLKAKTVKPKPRPKAKSKPHPVVQPNRAAAPPPPVSATVLQSVDGLWAVDVALSHGDQTVVRVNGRAVWLGTG